MPGLLNSTSLKTCEPRALKFLKETSGWNSLIFRVMICHSHDGSFSGREQRGFTGSSGQPGEVQANPIISAGSHPTTGRSSRPHVSGNKGCWEAEMDFPARPWYSACLTRTSAVLSHPLQAACGEYFYRLRVSVDLWTDECKRLGMKKKGEIRYESMECKTKSNQVKKSNNNKPKHHTHRLTYTIQTHKSYDIVDVFINQTAGTLSQCICIFYHHSITMTCK